MKRSPIKNKANKTRNATDVSNYKKQRNYVVKLNNKKKKSEIEGRGYIQIVISPPKQLCVSFIFRLFLVAAAELWVAFRWWCRFKHWPETTRAC